MNRTSKRLLAIVIVVILMTGMLPLTASAATAAELATQIGAAGLTATASGNTVTVDGNVSDRNTTLKLDISAGVTIVWRATFRGTANPVLDLWGSGTVRVEAGGWIQNTSSGNSFTALRANDSIELIIAGGTVQSRLGSAIEGAGQNTTVTVLSGTVFNEATHNFFPVINMTAPMPVPGSVSSYFTNVTVSGGEVFAIPGDATTVYGYVIQTYGNVLVSGGKVYTTGVNGRCINLVGIHSLMLVTGGEVSATGRNGVAISTATTANVDVTNTRVVITGGFVASYATANGWAIHTTGTNSSVSITGGCVFAYGNSITGASNSVIYTEKNAGALAPMDGNGVAIAWNRPTWVTAGQGVYFTNATNHIITLPTGITASWNKKNPPSPTYDGISYSYSGNTGFVELQEVTVVDQYYQIRALSLANTSGGSLSPEGLIQNIPYGESRSFTLEVKSGYIGMVDYYDMRAGDAYSLIYPPIGVFSGAGPITLDPVHTFSEIAHSYVIRAYFIETPTDRHFIRTNVRTGGRIEVSSPATQVGMGIAWVYTAPNSGTVPVTITATTGYYIKEVWLDTHDITDDVNYTDMSGSYPTKGTYTLPATTIDNTVTADFEKIPLTITATAGPGGSVSPLGDVTVLYGEDETFNITPAPGYVIDEVLRGPVGSPDLGLATGIQEFTDVVEDQILHVTFMQNEYSTYTITASANAGGMLIPAGLHPDTDPDQAPIINTSRDVIVPHGANQLFKMVPDAGFIIRDVIVNGISQGAVDNYTFDEVRSDNTIRVEFGPEDPTQPPPTQPPPTSPPTQPPPTQPPPTQPPPTQPPPPGEKAPQTGDDRNPVLPIILIALGVLAIIGLLLYRRKRKKDKK